MTITRTTLLSLSTSLSLVAFAPAHAGGPTFASDVEVQGSLCVGFDCPAAPAYGFDTIRLQENNLRIHFDDTSVAAAFPRNDWGFQANDSSNGGDEYMAILDRTAGRQVFRVDAGARTNALYVDSQGDVGIGTSTPATDIDIKIGDTPTLRLQQDGTSGFAPQTWDVAGNEAGFFIRDATSGSTLPFRIRPGAPSSAVDVENDGDVRIGKSSATDFQVDILQNTGTTVLKLATASGGAAFQIDADNNGNFWNMTAATGDTAFNFNRNDGDPSEMILDIDGNLDITGVLTVTGGTTVPDYVFADDYELMPLHEVEAFIVENRHLPRIPSATTIGETGLNMTDMQMALLEKVEELTLYTLEQQRTIDNLHERNAEQAARMVELSARLEAIEAK